MDASIKKETKTIQKRKFELELSDADIDKLCEKAASVGMMPQKLLEEFIGDLVSETCLAESWITDLRDKKVPPRTFLCYLSGDSYEYSVESVLERIHQKESAKQELVTLEKLEPNEYRTAEDLELDRAENKEEIRSSQQELEEIYHRYLAWTDRKTGTLEQELEKLRAWEDLREELKNSSSEQQSLDVGLRGNVHRKSR